MAGAKMGSKLSSVTLRACDLRVRRGARVAVLDPENRVLLFEYKHKSQDALHDKGSYFTIPGGGLKGSESFRACAERELAEETGIVAPLGPAIASRQAPMLLPSGEFVLSTEKYFAIHVGAKRAFDTSRWTAQEQRNIAAVHWFKPADLVGLRNLWPSCLPDVLENSLLENSPLEIKSEREQIGDLVVHVDYS